MKHYLWCDLETTGLQDSAYILEAAFIVTNTKLEELGHVTFLYRPPNDWLDRMNNFVLEMHTSNGLINDITSQWSGLRPMISQAKGTLDYERPLGEERVLDWLTEEFGWDTYRNDRAPEIKAMRLAGSTIEFDKKKLERDMPYLVGMLDYHTLNVSSIREDLQDTHPDVVTAWYKTKQDGNHRALADIRNSIAELKFYREWRQNGN